MTLYQKLTDRIGKQLDGSESSSAAYICKMSLLAYLFCFLWSGVSILSDFHPGIATSQFFVLLAWSGALIVLNMLLGKSRRFCLGSLRTETLYTHIVIVFYTFTTMTTCFLIGPLNTITGMVIMNAPMMGLILFRPAPVIFSLVSGALYLLTLSLLAVNNQFPFTPLLATEPTYYTTVISIGGACLYITYELIIMACLVKAWRDRESGAVALSLTDSLTGIANRRQIVQQLTELVADRRNSYQDIGVIMTDIDHFKRINDQFGHQAGDQVLRLAAMALRNCLRQQDHIGRYGGEEFLMVLPGASTAQASRIAERCRLALAELDIPGNNTSLTASFGVSCLPQCELTGIDLIVRQADDAMYSAKQQGRNQVVIYSATNQPRLYEEA